MNQTDLSGNPCPFLRALVGEQLISNEHDPLTNVSAVAARAFPPAEKQSVLRAAIYAIALSANGLGPTSLVENARHGLRADQLRGGPLDKRGVGTRVLDQAGRFDPEEFRRFDEFAVDCADPATGDLERGLGAPQLVTMMDANYARAVGHRRRVDRKLMDGEWPILLRLMGKPGVDGPYLSLSELRALLEHGLLPERVRKRLHG